ncbi:MAG: lysophospholipid acyltransferase family protein, partial [Pseudomonadota bacterium]
ILAPNHFHFVDPPLLLASSPRQIEFVAGAQRPNAPGWAQIFPRLWGYIPAFRGSYSRSTLTGATQVLAQGGVLGIFPEGGSWAKFLRPARPGTAYIAALSGAPVVPVSIVGGPELLGKWRNPVTVKFHPPIAAPVVETKGQERRAALDLWSEQLMAVIASALPDERRGRYSSDAKIRAAAEAESDFPFDDASLRGI